MKKIILWLVVLILSISFIGAISLVGCKEKVSTAEEVAEEEVAEEEVAEEEVAEEEEPVEINMLMKSAPELVLIKELADMYMSENPNVTITINELGRDVYEERMKNQLYAKSPDIDIVSIINSSVGLYAESGILEDLSPFFKDENANVSGISEDMFLDGGRNAVTFNESMYAIPWLTSTIFLYYRTDLIDNPPKTWEEYVETAKQFTQSLNPDSPTEYGTTMQGKRGSLTTPKEFSAFLWSFGGDYISDSGEILIANEGAKEALKLWVRLYRELKVVPPDITSYEYQQVLQAFQEGKTAMALQWDAAAGSFADSESSPDIYDKFDMVIIPGVEQPDGSIKHVPYLHNWVFAISKFSEKKEEAFAWLSFLNHPDNFKKALNPGISTALKDVLNSEEFKKDRVTFNAYKESLEVGRAYPATKYMESIQTIVDFAISQALAGELTAGEALDSAADKIKETIEE